MKFLSMISEIDFFQFNFEKWKKNVDVTLHAALEKRYVTEHQAPFINRTVTKEILKRSGGRGGGRVSETISQNEILKQNKNLDTENTKQ